MIDLRAALRGVNNRVMLTVARAVLSRVDDSKKIQSLQVQLLKREIRDDIERFQEYGFTSAPFTGAEAVLVFVGGNRDHGLCIAVDDRRYRLKGLADGEVALYTDEGDKIHFKRGNTIEVTTHTFKVNATTKIEFNTPQLEMNSTTEAKITTNVLTVTAPNSNFSGNVTAQGNVSDVNGSMQEMRTDYNGHAHPSGVVTPQMT